MSYLLNTGPECTPLNSTVCSTSFCVHITRLRAVYILIDVWNTSLSVVGWTVARRCYKICGEVSVLHSDDQWMWVSIFTVHDQSLKFCLTLYGHIKTAEQRTITHQYGDWYTGRWWVCCYIRYSEEGPGRAAAPPSTLLAVANTASIMHIPTLYYSMCHYNCLCNQRIKVTCRPIRIAL